MVSNCQNKVTRSNSRKPLFEKSVNIIQNVCHDEF